MPRRRKSWMIRCARRIKRTAFAVALLVSLALPAAFALVSWAAWHSVLRATPPPLSFPIAEAVRYERRVAARPRRAVVHIATVDLTNPNVEFVVTPAKASGDRPFEAATTSQFAERMSTAVAINGDYFAPYRCGGPHDYSPHSGAMVQAMGLSVSGGIATHPALAGFYSRRQGDCTIFFPSEGGATPIEPLESCRAAISGGPVLVRGGAITCAVDGPPHPQTAIGIDLKRERLWMVVVDGRQPGYSDGMTSHELAKLFVEIGADWALRLDGGGSSTMVLRPSGAANATVQNMPIHAGVPGWERPVANHLGVRILRSN